VLFRSQSFFWKNRGDNPCSDGGLNEFLRWVKIIERIKIKPDKSVAYHSRYIKELKDSKKFDSDFLSIPVIEKYFIALHKLFQEFDNIDFNVNWVNGNTSQADYFRLFPVLLYCTNYSDFDLKTVKRMARFFKNVVQLPDVAKNPDDQTINAIRLMIQFLGVGYTDVVDLSRFKEIPEYKNILTEEEIFKLELYAAQDTPTNREAIEEAFWKCEDFVLNAGRISFILYCSGQKFEETELDNFDLKKFIKISDSFMKLFSKPSDELRRALLTKGDYSIKDGYSTNLWADRYALGHNSITWKRILADPENQSYIKRLLKEFIKTRIEDEQSHTSLIRIIKSYLSTETRKDWGYHFIANPDIMAFCEEKKFVWGSDEFDRIYVMRRTKATDYRPLSDFVEE